MTDGEIPSTDLAGVRLLHRKHVEPMHGPARGASVEDIAELERVLGFKLPQTYKEFLEWMGRDYLGVLCGTDWFVDQVPNNNLALPELLHENRVHIQLPEQFVCFLTHQGYVAAWFGLPAADDPDCWIFAEGRTPEPSACGAFSKFLFEQIHGLAVPKPVPEFKPPIARWLARIERVVRPSR